MGVRPLLLVAFFALGVPVRAASLDEIETRFQQLRATAAVTGSDLALLAWLDGYRRVDDGWLSQVEAASQAAPGQASWQLLLGIALRRRADALAEGRAPGQLPMSQRRAVESDWRAGWQALTRAVDLMPDLGVAHAERLDMKRRGLTRVSARSLLARASREAPASLAVLAAMIRAADPLHGGNEASLAFLHGEARRLLPRLPDAARVVEDAHCRALLADGQETAYRSLAALLAASRAPHAECRIGLARRELRGGDGVRALRELRRALADPEFAREAALLLSERDDAGRALADLERAIASAGDEPALLRRRAWLQWRLGESGQAFASLEAAVRLHPLDARAWSMLGRLRAIEGSEMVAARSAITASLRIDPAPADVWMDWLQLAAAGACRESVDFDGVCRSSGCPESVRRNPDLRRLANVAAANCRAPHPGAASGN